MIAKILMDNRKQDASLEREHGFSMYLETENNKCLVDVGASEGFARNAHKLDIDIADIDYLFLTHGHADHVGGLPFFLRKNKKAKIIVSEQALSQKYYSSRRGLKDISPNIQMNFSYSRFIRVAADTILEKDIRIFHNVTSDFPTPKGNSFLMKDSGDGLMADDFNHELLFCFGEKEQMVCTGCAHGGLQNILNTVTQKTTLPIKTVIGGFHLLDTDDMNQYESMEEVEQIALALKNDYPDTMFYTGHCTGEKPYNQMKKILGSSLDIFYVGKEITINF